MIWTGDLTLPHTEMCEQMPHFHVSTHGLLTHTEVRQVRPHRRLPIDLALRDAGDAVLLHLRLRQRGDRGEARVGGRQRHERVVTGGHDKREERRSANQRASNHERGEQEDRDGRPINCNVPGRLAIT